MRGKMLLGGLALVVSMLVPGSAFAWDGGRIVSVSCPEIHVKLMPENGPWKVLAVDEAGHTLVNVNVPGSAGEQVIGGLWTLDNATHQVTVTIGNAANIADGKVTRVVQLTNCAAPSGVAGPPGPPGPPGVGYDCTGAAVAAGGMPALCPGTPGKDGVTKVIHVAPKKCTSKRSYHFRVRKTFRGEKIVKATASEPGYKVTVQKVKGRFLVTWSTAGHSFTQGGVVRTVTVKATLANGHKVRLGWKYRPCMGKDGNLNDPSAAGQATGGSMT
jgi:hypothetical protein